RRQIRVVYDAFSALFDWLKTLFTLLPKVGRTAIAANARKTSNRAYSTRSCPSSSRMNFFINSIIVLPPFGGSPFTSSVVGHSLRFVLDIGRRVRLRVPSYWGRLPTLLSSQIYQWRQVHLQWV